MTHQQPRSSQSQHPPRLALQLLPAGATTKGLYASILTAKKVHRMLEQDGRNPSHLQIQIHIPKAFASHRS